MKITVAPGDGIGPEVMQVVLDAFRAAGVPLEYEMVEMGRAVAERGEPTGITPEARHSVESTGILFKGPMETPKGTGHKSVNVTARKLWGTFANKRVYRVLPGVDNPLGLDRLDLTMIRENIEDTYGAVEHMQTHDVAQCRRFITRPGSEQVHRFAFETADRKGARRITCAHKANIMKMTDGLFLETFYEVAKEFPHIKADDVIVDALAMKLVLDPSEFDVIVLPNFQGDILTDLAAGIIGGLAYAPSANIGDGVSIFEAVHGTAPDIVGQDLANPTALLLSGTMMLRHLGLGDHAQALEIALENALLAIEKRKDVRPGAARFTTSVFRYFLLEELKKAAVPAATASKPDTPERTEHRMLVSPPPSTMDFRGVDVFLESAEAPAEVARKLENIHSDARLIMISNRGTQVWPSGSVHTDCINHYRVRFESAEPILQADILDILSRCSALYELCSAEWLRTLEGERAYSLAQGQSTPQSTIVK